MEPLLDRLRVWVGELVVVDCASPYVAIGKLSQVASDFLELADADMHDLRDTDTTRELYLVKAAQHGVQPNRKVLVLRMSEVVGVARLSDVATG